MINFEQHLKRKGLSENTIRAYVYSTSFFLKKYSLSIENLLEYKGYLIEKYKPKTVNLRIQGINKFLEFSGQEKMKLSFIKIQQKTYLEDVISHADYRI